MLRKLTILGMVCLMAIPVIFASVSEAAIDTKNIVGVWLFDEVNNKGMSPDSTDNGNDTGPLNLDKCGFRKER